MFYYLTDKLNFQPPHIETSKIRIGFVQFFLLIVYTINLREAMNLN